MNSQAKSRWIEPGQSAYALGGPGRSEDEDKRRLELASEVRSKALANNWSMTEAARRMDMQGTTFSSWYSGKYKGRFDNQNDTAGIWLASFEEAEKVKASAPKVPEFVDLKATSDIMFDMHMARTTPGIVTVTAPSGFGKTFAAEWFMAKNPRVYMANITPKSATVHGSLSKIAKALGVLQANTNKLEDAISNKLKRVGDGTLLIIDEAQNLYDDAINQIRTFNDEVKCGICFLGNTATYTRVNAWAGVEKYHQLHSRIMEKYNKVQPFDEDLYAYARAWGVSDERAIRKLVAIGKKGGALREIKMTMQIATMHALGAGRNEVTLADIDAAWTRRNVEVA